MAVSGLEMPPAQNLFQSWSILLLSSGLFCSNFFSLTTKGTKNTKVKAVYVFVWFVLFVVHSANLVMFAFG